MQNNDLQKRAELRRQKMVITKTKVHESANEPDQVFGFEAMELAALLSRQAWAFGRRPFLEYDRENIPVRFVDYDTK